MKKIENYINGSIKSSSKFFLDIFDPSKGEKIGDVVLSAKSDFDEVIRSSENAFSEWSKVTPLKRSRIISNYKNIIEKNIDILAKILGLIIELLNTFTNWLFALFAKSSTAK